MEKISDDGTNRVVTALVVICRVICFIAVCLRTLSPFEIDVCGKIFKIKHEGFVVFWQRVSFCNVICMEKVHTSSKHNMRAYNRYLLSSLAMLLVTGA